MEDKIKLIRKFYAGITRDDKSSVAGAASNIEEMDIFANADYIIPEQIMTQDIWASSDSYAYTADSDDNVWVYGQETSTGKIRLGKVTTGGADNPGAISTTFTSSDASDLAYEPSPIQYFRRDDGNQDFLYYLSNASGTIKLRAYDITAGTESEQDSVATNMTLTGLDGSFDRLYMKVIFGELYVSNGQYIAKVDKDGVFTEKAFTLPNDWEVVDQIPVSDVTLLLARNVNTEMNMSMGFWWDLTATVQVDDSFNIPFGGPQWVVNFRERILMCCAHNGKMKLFTLAGAFPGAQPQTFQDIQLDNVGEPDATQPISAPKMVSVKDNILYFGLLKTDKTGIYALGQLDDNKPFALILSKRFDTSDYSSHEPTALLVHGPNYYAAFVDNSSADSCRCESLNSPTRSSNAVYETIWLDDQDPVTDKDLRELYVSTYPLAASTSVAVSVASDYGSYGAIKRPDGTDMDDTSDIQGLFKPKLKDKKNFKIKTAFTSNGTDAVKMTSIAYKMGIHKTAARN